jgi:RecA-family ATPase
MTAKELLDLNITEIPMLVENMMQKTGLVGITGSSDVGKSCFLRQLALSIAGGHNQFLGFRLNISTRKVIYVSTEDMMLDLAFIIRKHLGNPEQVDECWKNLIFITDTQGLFDHLDILMTELSPDCVIIDAFTDIHTGDMHMTTSVRAPLNTFKELAQKHQSLFVVLNHVGKRTESNIPSKHNSIGSQGFEAKMRMLAEIRLDETDKNKRHLCIVKGNYLPNEQKKNSIVLKMDNNTLLYQDTGERVLFEDLGSNRSSMRDKWLPRCCEIKAEHPDKTIDEIYEQIKEEGFTGARATVGNYSRMCEENG